MIKSCFNHALIVLLVADFISLSVSKKVFQPNPNNLDGELLHGNAKFNHTLPKTTKKLNISEPSLSYLEKQLEIKGKKLEKNNKNAKINVNKPSLDQLEKELEIKGHHKGTTLKLKLKKSDLNPSLDKLEAELLHNNPKFDHKIKLVTTTKQVKNRKMQPSLEYLNKQVEMSKDKMTKFEKNITGKKILPSYEGFHGILVHGDESYNKEHNHTTNRKPADLEDFKIWLESEQKKSKLSRFKELHDEYSKLGKKIVHDDDENYLVTESVGVDLKQRDLGGKLAQAIKDLEKEELDQKRKFDL